MAVFRIKFQLKSFCSAFCGFCQESRGVFYFYKLILSKKSRIAMCYATRILKIFCSCKLRMLGTRGLKQCVKSRIYAEWVYGFQIGARLMTGTRTVILLCDDEVCTTGGALL